MRIISGSARGTKLYTLEGDNTRPTAERAKEALFSILQWRLEGRRVLDAYAGSGQLALEALSRGAAEAFLIDNSREAAEIIRKNIEKTHMTEKCTLIVGDTLERMGALRGGFDIIFLDPPYASRLIPPTLRRIEELDLLKKTGIVVCETDSEAAAFGGSEALEGRFEVVKHAKYGVIHLTLLKRREVEA